MPTPKLLLASLALSATVSLMAPQSPSEPLQPSERPMHAAAASRPVLALPEPSPTTTQPPPPTTTTTTATTQPPAPPTSSAPVVTGDGDPNDPATWERLCGCETGYTYDWATNTGNGYYGGLQFSLASWQAVGGTGYPHHASKDTQIEMGQRLHAQGGWSHWPGCSRQFGWI